MALQRSTFTVWEQKLRKRLALLPPALPHQCPDIKTLRLEEVPTGRGKPRVPGAPRDAVLGSLHSSRQGHGTEKPRGLRDGALGSSWFELTPTLGSFPWTF